MLKCANASTCTKLSCTQPEIADETSVDEICCISQLTNHCLTRLHKDPHTAFSAYVQHSEEALNTQALLTVLSKQPTHAFAGMLVCIAHN